MQEELQQKGKVKSFCEQFLLKADESLAYNLQTKEFETHYNKNRKERNTIRQDLPIAKSLLNEEYQDLLRKHQMLEEIEKRDAQVAYKYQQMYIEEMERVKEEQKRADEELARKLQQVYIEPITKNYEKNLTQEEQDYELAKYLHTKEKIKYELNTNNHKNSKRNPSMEHDEPSTRFVKSGPFLIDSGIHNLQTSSILKKK